ncbi:MAG: diguanylate cyclase (GGDEF)-like protein, partial [Candidatus Paceibacteria bacterium]
MPEFSAVTFSGDQDSLFSADEVKGLMRSECARATRYKYPVTAMRIAVDRLDQLGDLYGYESRDAILSEVTGVIRRNTRESDFIGYKVGGTFHAIFPHTAEGSGPALARRILQDTAKLMFDAGTARVQVTLSVGITFCAEGKPVDFETIMAESSVAIGRAVASGGGRFEV